MKTEITLEDVQTFTKALDWENTIEIIARLHEHKKTTQYHGMIALLFAIGAFNIYRFCKGLSREILTENDMPEEQINYFLDFEKYLGEKG